eukprot:5648533-Karenia_brevis.AAC.1
MRSGHKKRYTGRTRGGTRDRNLLLRREVPYPLGHKSACRMRSFCQSLANSIDIVSYIRATIDSPRVAVFSE